jgi:hypothetical protein
MNFLLYFVLQLIIPRAGKVMSIIFVVLSRMSPTLEFEYHECAARVVFSSVGDIHIPLRFKGKDRIED